MHETEQYFGRVWKFMNNDERFHAHQLYLAQSKSTGTIYRDESRLTAYRHQMLIKYRAGMMKNRSKDIKTIVEVDPGVASSVEAAIIALFRLLPRERRAVITHTLIDRLWKHL